MRWLAAFLIAALAAATPDMADECEHPTGYTQNGVMYCGPCGAPVGAAGGQPLTCAGRIIAGDDKPMCANCRIIWNAMFERSPHIPDDSTFGEAKEAFPCLGAGT